MCWVGIDVSKDYLDICILEATGEIKHHQVENVEAGFKQIREELCQQNPHIVLEATGVYHLGLQKDLQDNHYQVTVVNPRQIVGFAKSYHRRNKTDKVDAVLLAQFAKERQPEASPVLTTMPKVFYENYKRLTMI